MVSEQEAEGNGLSHPEGDGQLYNLLDVQLVYLGSEVCFTKPVE